MGKTSVMEVYWFYTHATCTTVRGTTVRIQQGLLQKIALLSGFFWRSPWLVYTIRTVCILHVLYSVQCTSASL